VENAYSMNPACTTKSLCVLGTDVKCLLEFLGDLMFMTVVIHARNIEKGRGAAQVPLGATVVCG